MDDVDPFPLSPLTDPEALDRLVSTVWDMALSYVAAMQVEPFTASGDEPADLAAMDAWQHRHPETIAATEARMALQDSVAVRLGLHRRMSTDVGDSTTTRPALIRRSSR